MKAQNNNKVQDEHGNSTKPLLPAVFSSVEEAVRLLKLDKRRKWFEWRGDLVYDMKYTAPNSCTGCDGGGCRECGGTGKRVSHVPIPAFLPNGDIVKVVSQNGR